ncbi:MAG: hypothetical protein AAF348_07485 [Bacteroidota bacterium]
MSNYRLSELKYEDFPLKLFLRLLRLTDIRAAKIVGCTETRWRVFKNKWESSHTSLESDNQLEQQKKVSLSFVKSQKAALLLKWMSLSEEAARPLVEELGFKWKEDPEELVKYLTREIKKELTKYENETAILESMSNESEEVEKFDIDEAIASLELMGFNIDDYNKLTVGKYTAMSKVASKRIEKQNNASNG